MHSKWKARLDVRDSKFVTSHDLLKIVDSLEDLARLSNGKHLFHELAFDFPILVKSSLMHLQKPAEGQWGDINQFAELIGPQQKVHVIDVTTQREDQRNWTMRKWANYFSQPAATRTRTLNVISLEFSHTPFRKCISAPDFVKEVDWVTQYWPEKRYTDASTTDSDPQHESVTATPAETDATTTEASSPTPPPYPKVQFYFLSGVGGCYTDFHIDFGGSSVWYNVMSGTKIFYLIEPTQHNVRLYEQWIMDQAQDRIFFGDLVDTPIIKVVVPEKHTLLLPSAWIHSVYTPEDTLVIGGNFLHDDSISNQTHVFDMEERTRVQKECRFPCFIFLHWYRLEALIMEYKMMDAESYQKRTDSIPPWKRRHFLSLLEFLQKFDFFFPVGFNPPYLLHSLVRILQGRPLLPQTDEPRRVCYCQRTEFDGNQPIDWIACDACGAWFHTACVAEDENNPQTGDVTMAYATDLKEKEAEADWWFCNDCKKRISQDYFDLIKKERYESKKEKEDQERAEMRKSQESRKRPQEKRKREPEVSDAYANKKVSVEWNPTSPRPLNLKLRIVSKTPQPQQEPSAVHRQRIQAPQQWQQSHQSPPAQYQPPGQPPPTQQPQPQPPHQPSPYQLPVQAYPVQQAQQPQQQGNCTPSFPQPFSCPYSFIPRTTQPQYYQ